MSGNINISMGGGTAYEKIAPVRYASSSGDFWGNTANLYPGIFYEFGTISKLNLTEKGAMSGTYQEYMFEFTAEKDDTVLKLMSEKALYWPVVPQTLAGHRYQVSSLNGIVLFAEVATE